MTTLPTILATAMSLATADPFADMKPLEHAELGDHRGGMMINGLPINFAVVVRTTVEGAVSQGLQTVLTVDDRGGVGNATTSPIGSTGGANVSSASNGSMSMNLPTGTTILHQVQAEQVQTLIANTKSGVNLNHHTEINVDLPGFNAMTQTWYGNNRAAQLGIDAAIGGIGRW